MANYSVTGTQSATSSSYKTAIIITSSATTRRTKWFDILVGTAGTPADNYMQFDVSRCTSVGTSTAFTPLPLDPADAAALSAAGVNATAEGTVTANSSMWNVGINQRASYRWVAAPGSEIVGPATSSNGLVLRVLSGAYTGASTGTVLFQEQ
jgi:hypothetical protein